MVCHTQLSPIGLVDATLARTHAAGQKSDQDMIAFLWKIVRGEASSSEIDVWSKARVARLDAEARVTYADMRTNTPDVVELLGRLRSIQQQIVDLNNGLSTAFPATCLEDVEASQGR